MQVKNQSKGGVVQKRSPDLGIEAKVSQWDLMLALEHRDIVEVRRVLLRLPEKNRKRVILSSSKKPEFRLRTPLQAAAASGDLALFGEKCLLIWIKRTASSSEKLCSRAISLLSTAVEWASNRVISEVVLDGAGALALQV